MRIVAFKDAISMAGNGKTTELSYKYGEGKVKIEAGLKVNDIWFIELD